MALSDVVEYSKDVRGIRIIGDSIPMSALRYRIISLTTPAGDEDSIEYRPVKGVVEMRENSVIDLTDGRERLLIGPRRTEARFVPYLSPEKGLFQLNRDAPPFHMSRLWLQNEVTGIRFFLGNERLNPKLKWRLDGGGDQFRFCMDEYCKAYYEGI